MILALRPQLCMDRAHWSTPTSLPDFASPIVCNWWNHSLMPTRRMLRSVRSSETMMDEV